MRRKKRTGERLRKGRQRGTRGGRKEIGKETKKKEGEGKRERQDREGSERGGVGGEQDEEVAKVVMDASGGYCGDAPRHERGEQSKESMPRIVWRMTAFLRETITRWKSSRTS